jgi:hypothetical protein
VANTHARAANSITFIPHRAGLLVEYKANERLSVGFCERVVYLFNISARVNFVSAAGQHVPMRADFFRALSCLTARSARF